MRARSPGDAMITIYGKDSCPYTADAREHYARKGETRYINVRKDADGLRRMLEITGGQRRVPVIVEDGTVTIGFGGT
jgi:glutaredoxin